MSERTQAAARPAWLDMAEGGTVLGLKLLVLSCRVLGRRITRLFLAVVALYYVLGRPDVRRHSSAYLARVGAPSGFWANYRHMLRFAQVALDRLFWLDGRTDLFDVELHGKELFVETHKANKGVLLLGAHLGSFEALRGFVDGKNMPVHVVAHFANARLITSVLGDRVNARLIVPDADDMSFVLKLGGLIEQGELVAMLGDRYLPGNRTLGVPFLGGAAEFPVGAYLIASALKCPVYLCCALHTGYNRYAMHVEVLAERVELPRKNREEALKAYVQRYAERLEHYCKQAPDNWFNFYDFWSKQ